MKMNIKSLLAVSLFFAATVVATPQDANIRHTVVKGETITQIAQKYKVTPHDIFQLNPEAKNGIRENEILVIPGSAKPQVASSVSHTVKPKETMFGIARQYGITVDDLKRANPILEGGLKIGQVITIPKAGAVASAPAKVEAPRTETPAAKPASGGTITHVVAPKETKYGIAKKYGITVDELERQNPGIVQNLPIGYKLTINANGSVVEKPKPVTYEIAKTESTSTEIVTTKKKTGYANYEVKPGETIYSLTQSLRVTEAELYELNPTLREGLRTGMILKVPGRGSVIKVQQPVAEDLTKTISKAKRKQLVLLLPFNAQKVQGDTARSMTERLKKDAFLNMTLDFYSGAMMAIDSARTLGLNLDIRIYDSGESKLSSNIADLVKHKNLRDADAIVGPFYQQYAVQLAEALSADNVPVISPMSKEESKPLPNLFQSMPSEETGKRVMFDYMISKGNVIVISDPKRLANREFITTNYPGVVFAEVDENGGINQDNLKSLFVKDRPNYVVIDTQRTGMILSATNILLNEMANYNLQLAIIEPNETLDFEEISMKRLTILKLLYPSATRENYSPEAMAFQNAYKRENKVFPSQYAIRGFDVTFDTMLRLAQDKSFAASAAEDVSEHVESRFKYVPNGEGFANKGVYILQYNEDLSVKQVN